MLIADEDRNLYVLERLLEELPGKPAEIQRDHSALLQNQQAVVSPERAAHIKHIRYLLQDEK